MPDENRWYTPADEELRVIAAQQTLARWRHEEKGPRYKKSGSRVLYRGADLLAWLEPRRVSTADQPDVASTEAA